MLGQAQDVGARNDDGGCVTNFANLLGCLKFLRNRSSLVIPAKAGIYSRRQPNIPAGIGCQWTPVFTGVTAE